MKVKDLKKTLIVDKITAETIKVYKQTNFLLECPSRTSQQSKHSSENSWSWKCLFWCEFFLSFFCWVSNPWVDWLGNLFLALSLYGRHSNTSIPLDWSAFRSSLHLFSRHLEHCVFSFRVGDGRLPFRSAFRWKLFKRRRPFGAHYWVVRNDSFKFDHARKAWFEIFHELWWVQCLTLRFELKNNFFDLRKPSTYNKTKDMEFVLRFNR